MARRYGRKTSENVRRVMHERKTGKLRSGSGAKVTSRKQAIAIGLSEARREGDKVPAPAKRSRRKSSTSSGGRSGRSSGSRSRSTAARRKSTSRSGRKTARRRSSASRSKRSR